jgi:hypothetical protein
MIFNELPVKENFSIKEFLDNYTLVVVNEASNKISVLSSVYCTGNLREYIVRTNFKEHTATDLNNILIKGTIKERIKTSLPNYKKNRTIILALLYLFKFILKNDIIWEYLRTKDDVYQIMSLKDLHKDKLLLNGTNSSLFTGFRSHSIVVILTVYDVVNL